MSLEPLAVGDHVLVLDPALAQLRAIMRRHTGVEPEPNHHGTVDSIDDETSTVFVLFTDGQLAPYPMHEVRRR